MTSLSRLLALALGLCSLLGACDIVPGTHYELIEKFPVSPTANRNALYFTTTDDTGKTDLYVYDYLSPSLVAEHARLFSVPVGGIVAYVDYSPTNLPCSHRLYGGILVIDSKYGDSAIPMTGSTAQAAWLVPDASRVIFRGRPTCSTVPETRSIVIDGTSETKLGTIHDDITPSPNSRYLAFVEERDFYTYDLYVTNINGDARRLVATMKDNPLLNCSSSVVRESFCWTPDSEKLLYVTSTTTTGTGGSRSTKWQLRSVAIATKKDTLIFETAAVTTPVGGTVKREPILFPDISSDGSKVVFSYQNDIWLMNIDGTGRKYLTVGTATEWYPRWSGDGKWVTFLRNNGGLDLCASRPMESELCRVYVETREMDVIEERVVDVFWGE